MNYDKKIFKQYYGSLHIKLLVIQILLVVVAVGLMLFKLYFFRYVYGFIICIGIVSIPFTYCYYIRIKKQSERQRQWITNKKLYVERVLDSGLTAGGFVNHKETVMFDHISSVRMTNRYIIINGDIEIISDFNSVNKNKRKTLYKIPRNFVSENSIIELGEY